MTQLISVGVFVGAFGVHGEVRLKSYCSPPEAIGEYGRLCTEDSGKTFVINVVKPIKNGFSVRVDGVTTREGAEALAGTKLYVDRAILPSLPDDEFYHADLIGLAVVDTGGRTLGRVAAVENHGAGDYLEITGTGLKTPALLPFTRAAVPTIDLSAGRIIVDAPEGVFPK